jgi:hypothetical protein
MENKAGIWIDHSRALVFQVIDQKEDLKHLERDSRETTRSASGERTPRTYTSHDYVAEGHLERKEASRYQVFYDEVIASLVNIRSVAVIGPGEAKGEFVKRIKATCPTVQVGPVEAADKMTEGEFKRYIREQLARPHEQ